jgi:hypothetical protein
MKRLVAAGLVGIALCVVHWVAVRQMADAEVAAALLSPQGIGAESVLAMVAFWAIRVLALVVLPALTAGILAFVCAKIAMLRRGR